MFTFEYFANFIVVMNTNKLVMCIEKKNLFFSLRLDLVCLSGYFHLVFYPDHFLQLQRFNFSLFDDGEKQ